MKTKWSKLIVAIDLGVSLTKVFYRLYVEDALPIDEMKTVCSAVQRTTASRYINKEYADDNTALVAFDGNYWTVGIAAKQEVSITNIRTRKSRHAIAKVLSVVGQIADKHALELEGMSIELGVLLPIDEMKGQEELRLRLMELLYGFGYNGKQTGCLKVDGVRISPEGYGYAQLAQKFPAIVLMFGHRDVACLYINDGSISLSESRPLPGWGMVKLIYTIRYAFKDEFGAAEAIFNVGDVFTREKPLLRIVPPEDVKRVQGEIEEARSLVWNLLWDELTDSHIRKAEEVFAAGGNAFYWRPELKKALGSKLSTGGDLMLEMQQRFSELKEPKKAPLMYRCADCYAFWKSQLAEDELADSNQLALVEVVDV